jgi:mRNA-degrading endonuclease toxin of MazEF toxin-antitoxin module
MSPGDVVHLNWSPQSGKEMAYPHYGVILSSSAFNQTIPNIIVAPITSKDRPQFGALRIQIQMASGNISGYICLDHIRSVDPISRNLKSSSHSITSNCLGQCRSVIKKILL